MHTAAAYLRMRLGRRGQGGTVSCAQPIEAAHLLTASPSRVNRTTSRRLCKATPSSGTAPLTHVVCCRRSRCDAWVRSYFGLSRADARCSILAFVHCFAHPKVHNRLPASSEPSGDDHGLITHASSRITRSRLPTSLPRRPVDGDTRLNADCR
jgi:hypothetical protein